MDVLLGPGVSIMDMMVKQFGHWKYLEHLFLKVAASFAVNTSRQDLQ